MNNKLYEIPDHWLKRKEQIRSNLDTYLLKDGFPPRFELSVKVLRSNESEIQELRRKRIDEHFEICGPDGAVGCNSPDVQLFDCKKATWKGEYVEYAGWPGLPPVRAILRIPNTPNPKPAVLCLHGHSGGLVLGCMETDYFAQQLTQVGFVTLCPEAVPFGDRRLNVQPDWEKEFKGVLFWDERVLASQAWLEGNNLLGIQIWELMLGLDFLDSLADVDSTRIGSIGHSQGAFHSWWLGVVDDRVSAVVANAGVSSFQSWIDKRVVQALGAYVHGILNLCDQDELIAAFAPKPLMIINYAKDCFFDNNAAEKTSEFIKSIYRLLDAETAFEHSLVDQPHIFAPDSVQAGILWLKQWLGV